MTKKGATWDLFFIFAKKKQPKIDNIFLTNKKDCGCPTGHNYVFFLDSLVSDYYIVKGDKKG